MGRHKSTKEQKENKGGDTGSGPRTEKKRRCLGCQKAFVSEGAHHRICDNCKMLQRWGSGNPGYCSHRPAAANDNG